MTETVVFAEIQGVHGIRGWLKVRPLLEDPTLVVGASGLFLASSPKVRPSEDIAVQVVGLKPQGRGWVLKLAGIDDRSGAELLKGKELKGPSSLLPAAPEGEYYWRELVGLRVYNIAEQPPSLLGVVDYLLETGANDVLVVKPSQDSIDDRERLIPWRPKAVVTRVDVLGGELFVDWFNDAY